ncbi:hypothetical protein C3920_11580 [Novacetimonas pomaceti]|uniref:Uncharacterized protein n=1 Tax=Novacetimonas pomaceti TaxID=2021998 RepID=A0ABX5P2S7_9PROT|nr:hypothetical protein C3920_11580 [Novacetimonas pomaceti]
MTSWWLAACSGFRHPGHDARAPETFHYSSVLPDLPFQVARLCGDGGIPEWVFEKNVFRKMTV